MKSFLISFSLLLPLALFAQSQGEGSDADEETLRVAEYSDLDTIVEISDCFPLVKVQMASILNFETFSHCYIYFTEDLEQDVINNSILFIQKGDTNPLVLSMEWINGYLRVVMDTNE